MTVRANGDVPVGWYDGRAVHLGDMDVSVEGLQSLTAVEGGVAGVKEDGTVVLVDDSGAVQTLGTAEPATAVLASASAPGVAWQDPAGGLVVRRLTPVMLRTGLPPGATLAARSGTDTYVSVPGGGHLVVDDLTSPQRRPGPAPLAVAAGVRVERTDDGLRVVGAGLDLDLPGTGQLGARLSDDGRYLLTSRTASRSATLDVVVDLRRDRSLRVPLPDDALVIDAAFGDRPGALTVLLARPEAIQPGYDLLTCRLRALTCERVASVDTLGVPLLLAH